MVYFLRSWNSVKPLATSCYDHMAPLNQLHFTLKNVVSTEKYTSGSYRMMELAFPRQNFYNASTSLVLSAIKVVSLVPSGKGNSQRRAWPYCSFSLDSRIYSQFPGLFFHLVNCTASHICWMSMTFASILLHWKLVPPRGKMTLGPGKMMVGFTLTRVGFLLQ